MGSVIIKGERSSEKIGRTVFELVEEIRGQKDKVYESPHWKIYPEGLVVPPDVSSETLSKIHSISVPDYRQAVLSRLENQNVTWSIKENKIQLADDKKVWLPEGEMRLWSIPRKTGMFLHWFSSQIGAQTVLELGTSAGYSGIWLSTGIKSKGGTLYTVDISPTKIEMAKNNFKEARVDNVIQLRGEIGEILKDWEKPIDLVFLDADKPNYAKYMEKILPKMKPGAYVIADNAFDFMYLMKDFVSLLRDRREDLYSYVLHLDNGLYLVRKDEPIDNKMIMSFFNSSSDFV